MARYDYGLRGAPYASIRRDEPRGRDYDSDLRRRRYDAAFQGRYGRIPRVTAAYNRDYVREEGPPYPTNHHRYGGFWRGQIGGEGAYRQPYMTRGGTWTYRGADPRPPYDYRDYGAGYGSNRR